MELTRDKAKENLARLIEKFERELPANKIKDYNEEATKISFIQPLLKEVLGWEVGNQDEVSPEERISRGRVDYGLKVEGKIKVFVEAKPPRADLNKHIEQAVRYGYNRKGVPFVLLTDFEELKLFDVTVKPDSRNPLKGLKIDLRWNNYLKEFDKIWLFSKESVIKGELDKLLLVKPKDRLPVDKAILDDLKRWRESLAKDIFKNNRETVTDAVVLKEITRRILDRIIFMRFCEDRNFVHRRPLKELFEERTETVGLNTMVFLKEEFKHYNLIFDSDLFRPQDWESAAGGLAIDFRVMKEIVLDTYNPYQFDVIPLEVLGNIYEQYLGYTIRLTDHQVKYELKPDVRKAGGVYYTPEYIVDYIVKNTVGKLLHEMPANKIKKLRILDPACGSGSFLIRAYEEMLNYYKNQKKKHKLVKPQVLLEESSDQRELNTDKHRLLSSPSMGEDEGEGDTFGKQRAFSLPGEETEPRLTIEEKSQILREHIFGVDIDEQAVEVTKLSLMLKMLEGEFRIIPGRAILPMLDKNIRCGNSLISGSPLGLKDLFGEDFYKTKPLNWKEEFRKIMVEEGGFDVVIGNPPYFSIDKVWGKKSPDANFIKQTYPEIWADKTDILFYFLAKAIQLSKQIVGFIVSRAFLEAYKAKRLREFILSSTKILSIVDFDGFHVFEAGISTAIPILAVEPNKTIRSKNKILVSRLKTTEVSSDYVGNFLLGNKDTRELFETFQYKQEELKNIPWNFVSSENKDLNRKIDKSYPKLDEICDVGQGMQTGRNDIFGNLFPNDVKRLKLETNYLKKRATNSDIQRYFIIDRSEYLIYIDDIHSFKELPPHIADYLRSKESELKKRAAYQRGDCEWWKFTWPLHKEWYSKPKILCPYLAGENRFVLDITKEFIGLTDTTVIFAKDSLKEDIRYLLAILNSGLLTYRFRSIGKLKSKNIYEYFWNSISKLPIRKIDFSNKQDKKHHDDLVALVDVMLDLNKKIQTAKGSQKDQIQRQIEKTDKEIDDIVYKLYNITEVEKKIIEGN